MREIYRHELRPNCESQRCRVFVWNDLVERKIKSYRKSLKKFLELKEKFWLDRGLVTCDKQDVVSALHVAFEREITHAQYCIERNRFDPCLPKYKLGIEVDEFDYESIDPNYEQSRQLIIDSRGITVISTNPGAPDCINRLINQIYIHNIEWTKKQTEKSTKKSLMMIFQKYC